MRLSDDERSALITYRLEKAQNTMKHVKGNAAMDFWPVVTNRLYYAAYYAVTALLLGKGLTVQTSWSHPSIQSAFYQDRNNGFVLWEIIRKTLFVAPNR